MNRVVGAIPWGRPADKAAPLSRIDGGLAPRDEVLEQKIAAVETLCRDVLANRYDGFGERLPQLCRLPEDWFALLHGLWRSPANIAVLRSLREAAERSGGEADGAADCTVEHYALLQAFLVALPRLPDLPVEPGVKRLTCDLFATVAQPRKAWADRFHIGSERFIELAQLATLTRFTAGQHDWVETRLPQSWLLTVRPRRLPGLLREMAALGGFPPLLSPHLNYFRPNGMMVLEAEAERSYWRMARSLEFRPEIKGLVAYSWFFSPAVAEITPHLAWMRTFFTEKGAFCAEMERADPESGFLVGSAKRRQLYEAGQFHPRVTMLLWRRDDMLAWAASRPDLGAGA